MLHGGLINWIKERGNEPGAIVKTSKPELPDAHDLSKVQYEQLAHFRYELRRYLRFSEEAVRSAGISPLQYQLLLQIKGFPERNWATIGELAERLQSHHHGAVALISRCEQQGLVERVTDVGDRRKVRVRLKPKGERCLARLARLHHKELLDLHGGFTIPVEPKD